MDNDNETTKTQGRINGHVRVDAWGKVSKPAGTFDAIRMRVSAPFRFRDQLTGKWVRARRKLQAPELQRRYAEWEIVGAPEIRHLTPGSGEP